MPNNNKPAHSKIGASSAERWWNCPGSVALQEEAPPELPKPYAAEGTIAHELGEFYLKAGVPVDTRFLGDMRKADGFEFEVTEEMLEAVTVYVDYIRNIMEYYNLRPHHLKVEQGFSLQHIDVEAYGTCDAMIHVPWNKLIVVDYKHGRGVAVSAENNKQILYYALGGYWNLPEKQREQLGSVETVIVQPRSQTQEGVIKKATYTIDELLKWQDELFSAITRVRRGVNTLSAGAWCRWCKAKTICPEAKTEIDNAVMRDFQAPAKPIPKPEDLTPEQLGTVLTQARFIKSWCDEVIERAQKIAGTGVEIPGFKMVKKRSNRRWVSDKTDDLVEDLRDANTPRAALYTQKLKSPAQMESMLKKAKIDFDLSEYYEKPDAGTTLAPVSDERASESVGAEAAFKTLES